MIYLVLTLEKPCLTNMYVCIKLELTKKIIKSLRVNRLKPKGYKDRDLVGPSIVKLWL